MSSSMSPRTILVVDYSVAGWTSKYLLPDMKQNRDWKLSINCAWNIHSAANICVNWNFKLTWNRVTSGRHIFHSIHTLRCDGCVCVCVCVEMVGKELMNSLLCRMLISVAVTVLICTVALFMADCVIIE